MARSRKVTDVQVFCVTCGESVGYVVEAGHKDWLCEKCGQGKMIATNCEQGLEAAESAGRQPMYLEPVARRIYHWAAGENPWYPAEETVLWLSYALLCVAKGTDTTSRDVHDAWSVWSLSQSIANQTWIHRSVVPFDELLPEVQAYDDEYRDAIHAIANELARKSERAI